MLTAHPEPLVSAVNWSLVDYVAVVGGWGTSALHLRQHIRGCGLLCKIADVVEIPGRDELDVDPLKLVYNWLSNKDRGCWLLVLDNAEDQALFSSDPPLADFLPQSHHGTILITSCSQSLASRLTGGVSAVLKAEPMDQDRGVSLLNKKLPESSACGQAIDMVEELEGMPLAIT
ncbi:hypothetical protein EJ06DRAFT_558521 [Trichodelitschia bisporula]|uniref:NB-ARC domain-containing protein n=1 Tax=Trichodelitschia bisporula TaxID=703511 RepID=A0A6G1HQE3_9PEZI|nr:hypothetical protein EJ06DRAFT_558521 [Trichodelitschia bisporula]